MVLKIVIVVFASVLLVPLLLYCSADRPPRPYFEGMWSAEELDNAYSAAVESAHPRREKRKPGPPLMVAGLTRECLKHLPAYTGCNHEDIREAAQVCAGGDRSERLQDNRQFFPVKVGHDPNGNPIQLVYSWTPEWEQVGHVSFAYTTFASEAQCDLQGGKKGHTYWGYYMGCYPDHTKNCEGAAANQQ